MSIKWGIKISIRLLFISIWFIIGYLPNDSLTAGFVSSIAAFLTMEFCYYVDKRTSGFEKIIERVDYLGEILLEVQKTKCLILEEFMILEANVSGETMFSKGVKSGIAACRNVIEHRFTEVSSSIANKKNS